MTAPHIRTLIVDDEPLARRGIRARLAASSDVSVVGECASGRTAVESIHSLAPDLIFLDVQMPEVDGFAVVESVTAARMPIVIFVTAFDSHALRAFEAHAIDYLLKPIDDARFAEALGRVRERVRDRAAGVLAQQLGALLADVTRAASAPLDRVAVRDRGRLVLLDPRRHRMGGGRRRLPAHHRERAKLSRARDAHGDGGSAARRALRAHPSVIDRERRAHRRARAAAQSGIRRRAARWDAAAVEPELRRPPATNSRHADVIDARTGYGRGGDGGVR